MKKFFFPLIFFLCLVPIFLLAQTPNANQTQEQLADIKKNNLEMWDRIYLLQDSMRDQSTKNEVNEKYLKEILNRIQELNKRLLIVETEMQKKNDTKTPSNPTKKITP